MSFVPGVGYGFGRCGMTPNDRDRPDVFAGWRFLSWIFFPCIFSDFPRLTVAFHAVKDFFGTCLHRESCKIDLFSSKCGFDGLNSL
jgi:hypothetical protein